MTGAERSASRVAALAEPGSVWGPARSVAPVSVGPFSEVWLAEGLEDGQPLAVKIARGEHGERMLREEASLTRRLRYQTDRVPRVIAFEERAAGEGARASFLVLPWLGGGTFRARLERILGEDDRVRAARTLLEVVDAVGVVHLLGVVHGDLKPENVLVDAEGRPVLVDFGLARVMRDLRRSRSLAQSLQTEDGLTGGTLAYMAPEVVKGGEPSYQADVYALGVMLHEVLLGRRPDKVTSPEVLKRQLPAEVVDRVLLRALAYDPRDRFPGAGDLATALRAELVPHLRTGLARWVATGLRFVLGGLAAFFVALRYVSVAALLAAYAAVVVAAVAVHPAILLLFLVVFLMHLMIRWEGVEGPDDIPQRTGFFWRR